MKNTIDEFETQYSEDESIIKETIKEKITDSSTYSINFIIKSISKALVTILEDNKKLSDYKQINIIQSKMIFNGNSIPKISIYDYLNRIQYYSSIEIPTLICSLIYIDRICQIAGITLTYYNIHRIVFAAILTSIKYNEDVFFDNNYYAQIAGIRNKELKLIEFHFLELLDFNLFIKNEQYYKYKKYLENFLK